MNRAGFLNKAREIICHDRERQYGSPENNFGIIAELWTAYLGSEVCTITPKDVAWMMALMKAARDRNGIRYHEDNYVDAIGYLACGGEIASEEDEAMVIERVGGSHEAD